MVSDIKTGLFLPTTYEFDIQRIQDVEVNSPEFKELIVRLYQTINNIAIVTNFKESGFYVQTEFVTGNLWYPDPTLTMNTTSEPIFRPTYRITVPFGALVNNATKSVPHGITLITASFRIKEVFGVTNKLTLPFSYIPLNYADSSGNIASIIVDATNINITTTSVTINWSLYTDLDIVILYVKQ